MRPLSEIVSKYCEWVECPTEHPNLSDWLIRILTELTHAACCLPADGLADAGAEDFQRPEYQDVRVRLPKLPVQYYRDVHNPTDYESNEDPTMGDLYDDLTDVYLNLSEGLFIHRSGLTQEAERYWSQSFRYHWGEHATNAVRVLYWVIRSQHFGAKCC